MESEIITILQVGRLVERTQTCCIQNHVHYSLLTKWVTGSSGPFPASTDKLKTHVRTVILQTPNGVIMIMFWIDVGAGHARRLQKLLAKKKKKKGSCLYPPIRSNIFKLVLDFRNCDVASSTKSVSWYLCMIRKWSDYSSRYNLLFFNTKNTNDTSQRMFLKTFQALVPNRVNSELLWVSWGEQKNVRVSPWLPLRIGPCTENSMTNPMPVFFFSWSILENSGGCLSHLA